MEVTQMSTDRWMDKEAVVHIYNGILLTYKKEHIWVSANEVDEPRAYYTEWIKTEREKQIPYFNTYIQNLVRWYWWTYLQHSNGDTDTEIQTQRTDLKWSEIAQSCLTLCDPMDSSLHQDPPSIGFSRQEWVAISFSSESYRPRTRTQVPQW